MHGRHDESDWAVIDVAEGVTADDLIGRADVRAAAKEIYGWARNNPSPPTTWAPSLVSALTEWQKIG